ncbi:MAG: hypothetical protein ACOCWR_02680 [Oceanidesulfovibrio sp.]
MSYAFVGVLDEVRAFEKDGDVYVLAMGSNPTSGWKNDLQPSLCMEKESDLTFVQYPPPKDEVSLPVITPFNVVEVIKNHTFGDSLIMNYSLPNEGPAPRKVQINKVLTPSDEFVAKSLNPVEVYASDDPRIQMGEEETLAAGGLDIRIESAGKRNVFRRVIAGYDNPLDCCDLWPPRCRGSRNEWILEVVTASGHDIKAAVEDCLRQSATATALAAIGAVVVTGGVALQAAITAFITVLKPCLLAKLPDMVDISVRHKYRCK